MAGAKTPDSIYQESMGSCKLIIAKFETNDIDDGDTWASGIPGIVAYWFREIDAANGTKFGIAADESAGTFTFQTDEDNRQAVIHVLCKS